MLDTGTALALFGLLAAALPAQTPTPTTLPAQSPLVVQLSQHQPVRVGEPLRATLVYPVYANNQLVLPQGTVVRGEIVSLHANHPRRIRAELGGDFTPFHTPVVRFHQFVLPDSTAIEFASADATDGAPIFRAVAPAHRQGGFLRQELRAGLDLVRSDAAFFLAPGRLDRLQQVLYGELPYHPERLEKGTSWTVETTAPVTLPCCIASQATPPAPARRHHFWEPATAVTAPTAPDGAWVIQAYLSTSLSSESSHQGEPILATVVEPVYNPDHSIAIPQGATLVGAITRASRARRFGRAGTLNFSFRQLEIPQAAPRNVETTLVGADSAQALALTSEGQVKQPPQDKLSLPLFLAALASRPLDQDRHGAASQTGKDAAGGAAGLGLLGTVVAAAGGAPAAAAGIGYYGAAVAVYYRWIARGKTVSFPRDTRIVVQTVARQSPAMQPAPGRAQP
ncbi:MAG: hypothetical protein KGK08_04010 [Acidobacteriota bacterium]|nr:hypothetical protein [Acidobacteriota bacterium]